MQLDGLHVDVERIHGVYFKSNYGVEAKKAKPITKTNNLDTRLPKPPTTTNKPVENYLKPCK